MKPDLDEETRAHQHDLPGEEKYECYHCGGKFFGKQMYFAVNGDGCCCTCYEALTPEQQERFE